MAIRSGAMPKPKCFKTLDFISTAITGGRSMPMGSELTPLHIAAMLRQARDDGSLKLACAAPGESVVMKVVSGPDESAPVVQRLDLRC